jgi:hypothetical protein
MRASDLFLELAQASGEGKHFSYGGTSSKDYYAKEKLSKAILLLEDKLIMLNRTYQNGCEWFIEGYFTEKGLEEKIKNKEL